MLPFNLILGIDMNERLSLEDVDSHRVTFSLEGTAISKLKQLGRNGFYFPLSLPGDRKNRSVSVALPEGCVIGSLSHITPLVDEISGDLAGCSDLIRKLDTLAAEGRIHRSASYRISGRGSTIKSYEILDSLSEQDVVYEAGSLRAAIENALVVLT